MDDIVEDDLTNLNANEDVITNSNGKHWVYKVQQLFALKKRSSESSQLRNSFFERSTSSINRNRAEERICKELRYFFMNPCQKYKAKKRKPFKLAIQIFKIALVTIQLIIFGRNNQSLVDFKNDMKDVFQTIFFRDANSTFYEKLSIYSELNYIRQQYSTFENLSVGNFGYSEVSNADCSHAHALDASSDQKQHNRSVYLCVDEFLVFEADLDHNHLLLNTSGTKRKCHCLMPWVEQETNTSDSVPLINGSSFHLNFQRMNELEVYLGVRTVRLMSSHSYHLADCYNITLTAKYSNMPHTGKIIRTIDLKFSLSPCPNAPESNMAKKPVVVLLLVLDIIIIITCTLSLMLCARSLYRAQRLRKSFTRFYWKRYKKKIDWFTKWEFVNGWYFLIIVSDVLTVAGSITKIVIEMECKGVIQYDYCSLFLGVGCLCVWIGVLRYAGFFHQYNILVLTLKKSLPHVLRFMVCASVLYLGFLFCGWVVLGPYHHKFRNLAVTSEALFSLINGDDMYMTYEEMSKKSSVTWLFSQIYLYIFISLFIYIVLSLFIAVIMETYETIKEWQSANFPPQTEIQKYLAEHSNPNDDCGQYDYNSDTYCCCCLYHNNDPDIECHSSDEELIDP